MVLMTEGTKSDKDFALEVIASRPENFRWVVSDLIFKRHEILENIRSDSKTGARFVALVKERGMEPEDNSSNILGKRYLCLICDTQVLTTKAGPGRIQCCGQNIEQVKPRPVPGAD